MSELKQQFIAKLKAGNRYKLHSCSMCGYPCGWFGSENQIYYDSGCDCTRGGYNYQLIKNESDFDFYFDPKHGHIDNITKWVNEPPRDGADDVEG